MKVGKKMEGQNKIEDILMTYCGVFHENRNMWYKSYNILNQHCQLLDWEYILNKIRTNRIITPFFINLLTLTKNGLRHRISKNVYELIMGMHLSKIIHRIHLYNELRNIVKLLNTFQINFMLIKGSALAETVYPIFYYREQRDIDLIIYGVSNLEKAKYELNLSGYTTTETQQSNMGPKLLMTRRNGGTLTKVELDTNFSFDGYVYIPSHVFWDQSIKLEMGDEYVYIPSFEVSFLLVVTHALLAHRRLTLRDLSDILMILKTTGSFDFEYLHRISSSLGLSTAVYVVLCLANRLYNINIPQNVLDIFNCLHSIKDISKFLAEESYEFPKNHNSASWRFVYKAIEHEFVSVAQKQINPINVFRMVNYDCAFHFYKGFDNHTGRVAFCLDDFSNLLKEVDITAIEFHMENLHFIDWVSSLGDVELGMKLRSIADLKLSGETLRNLICNIVSQRILEIRRL